MTQTQMHTFDDDDLATFEAVVHRVRWYHQVELEFFRTLGDWASSTNGPDLDPGQRVTFGIHARYHAWHSELWQAQLPTAGQAFAGLSTEPFEDRFLEVIRTEKPILQRIEALYGELIPRLTGLYEAHLQGTAPMTDGPIIRVLNLVLLTKSSWAS
ncbi:MAG: hypothetical protein ACSLFB_01765 [Acidimicrobiales bacterium]